MCHSSTGRNEHVDHFWKLPDNFFRLEEGDQIVDIGAGKHHMIVATQHGKIYASGYIFYRYFSECRHNRESDEDYPFELRLPAGGWKALQVWGCEKYNNLWVLAEDADGKKKCFGAGGEECSIGHDEDSNSSGFKALAVPDGTWF